MNDTWTKLEKGSKGIVSKIEKEDDEALIWIKWDNGEKLALLEGIDKFKVVKNQSKIKTESSVSSYVQRLKTFPEWDLFFPL